MHVGWWGSLSADVVAFLEGALCRKREKQQNSKRNFEARN
jgi:hypothetical protein